MASRAQQKEQARQRRLAEEQARAEQSRRQRRLRMVLGVVAGAVLVAAALVAVAIGTSTKKSAPSPTSAGARQQASSVSSLLSGIPQAGNRLGAPTAKVTVTEFGDLECPVCRDFALGAQSTLISNDVRAGKVQLIYKSLCTATCNGPNQSTFPTQQAAAIAAGLQGKEWHYVELFYHEQGDETTAYVNAAFLASLARQIPGLNVAKWQSDSQSSTLAGQVVADQQEAAGKGFNSTPTILVQGPKGAASPIAGGTDYGTLEAAIKQVS